MFYLRDENGNAEDEAGTRNELRRRYWAFALEYIHEMHGDASFSNVHSSKKTGLVVSLVSVDSVLIAWLKDLLRI